MEQKGRRGNCLFQVRRHYPLSSANRIHFRKSSFSDRAVRNQKMSKEIGLSKLSMTMNTINVDEVREVWAHSFAEELTLMEHVISEVEGKIVIAVDTEFPGFKCNELVDSTDSRSERAYQKGIKFDFDEYARTCYTVNAYDVLQVGFSIGNDQGRMYGTWQFFFMYRLESGNYDPSALRVLSHMPFSRMETDGIRHEVFSVRFSQSPILRNTHISWATYHGQYDVTFLVKTIEMTSLPESKYSFDRKLLTYFPNVYDVKLITRTDPRARQCTAYPQSRGLKIIAARTGCTRVIGDFHSAGPDAYVTLNVFIFMNRDLFSRFDIRMYNGAIFFHDGDKGHFWPGSKYFFPSMITWRESMCL